MSVKLRPCRPRAIRKVIDEQDLRAGLMPVPKREESSYVALEDMLKLLRDRDELDRICPRARQRKPRGSPPRGCSNGQSPGPNTAGPLDGLRRILFRDDGIVLRQLVLVVVGVFLDHLESHA